MSGMARPQKVTQKSFVVLVSLGMETVKSAAKETQPSLRDGIIIQRIIADPWGMCTCPRCRADSRIAHDSAAEAEDTGCFDRPRTAPGPCATVSKDNEDAVRPAEGQLCLDVQHYPPGKSMYLAEVPMAMMKQLFPTITLVTRNNTSHT